MFAGSASRAKEQRADQVPAGRFVCKNKQRIIVKKKIHESTMNRSKISSNNGKKDNDDKNKQALREKW